MTPSDGSADSSRMPMKPPIVAPGHTPGSVTDPPAVLAVVVLLIFAVGWRLPKKLDNGELHAPVNMYIFDTLLFVSDQDSGINIYSIKDSTDPVFKMNIPIRGNGGLAVKDSIVYANSYSSLLVLKIHDDSLYDVV